MIVGALVWDPASKARLQDALRGQASVRFCERQAELVTLAENDLAGVIVVDMRDREGESTLATVRHIREAYPSVPVVLYCAISPETSRDVLAFARAGVNDLVLRDVDDLRFTLRTALAAIEWPEDELSVSLAGRSPSVLAGVTWILSGALTGALVILATPRVFFAMARDGLFLEAAARVHPRCYGTFVRFLAQYVRERPAPPTEAYAEAVVSSFKRRCAENGIDPPHLFVEPGRSLVARAGVALYTVGSSKHVEGLRTWVSVDGGMADNYLNLSRVRILTAEDSP